MTKKCVLFRTGFVKILRLNAVSLHGSVSKSMVMHLRLGHWVYRPWVNGVRVGHSMYHKGSKASMEGRKVSFL